jgi:hypothetical protein
MHLSHSSIGAKHPKHLLSLPVHPFPITITKRIMAFKSLAVVSAAVIASAVQPSSALVFPTHPGGPEATVPPKPVFTFGTPTFLGSGCPKDTVAIIPASDGQSVSVLFSAYSAVTTADVQRDRKSCNLAVPVDVQSGVSIGIFRVDYRGNVYVPPRNGTFAQFDAEYYFAGQRGPVIAQKYSPGTASDLFITNEIPVSAIVWSPCGSSTVFRVNSAITASKPTLGASDEVQIAIDSVDTTVQAGFRYYLQTRACK